MEGLTEGTAADIAYAKTRRDAAYWFAAGIYEAGQRIGTDHSQGFSIYAMREAADYRAERVSSLSSIIDQFSTYMKEQEA